MSISSRFPATIVRPFYDRTVRRVLPSKFANLNGVAVRTRKLFDFRDNDPEYKENLVKPLRDLVVPGDEVVIVGGGEGVASVVAARRVQPTGHVTTFEAAREFVDVTRESIRLNRADDVSDVVHGLVGSGIDVWGAIDGAEEIAPEDLPSADVLVIDAEGAELGILESCPIEQKFEHVIVETHDKFDSPPEAVRPLLDGMTVRTIPHADSENVTFVATCFDGGSR